MIRWLAIMNSLGIAAVVAVCVMQWHSIRLIDADRDRLERVRQGQAARIDKQTKTVSDQASDLEDVRRRLSTAEHQLTDLHQKLLQAIAERDALKEAIAKWKTALAARDAAIQKTGEQLAALMKQRDETFARFNDLATKYNDLVKKVMAETNSK